MSAVPAYSYPQPQQRPKRQQRPQIHAIPGSGTRTQQQGVSPQIYTLAKIAVVAILAFAVVACVRVGFAAATVTTTIQTQELSQQIDQARESANALEVSYSTLSNPTNVKMAASELGMVEPETTEYLDLGLDVVATDEAGNLSLTQSLERAGNQGA